jgi:3-keto-disaccharide hydrolase
MRLILSWNQTASMNMNQRLRNPRSSWLYTGATCLFVVAGVGLLSAQQSKHDLFNGKNLEGWQQVGPGSFVVKDGMMKTEGGMGMLWYSRDKIGHATVRVVFKLTSKESDSGVFIRIPERPTEPWMPINRGYEVEIGDWPDDYSCTGVLYTFTKALARPLKPIGEWNTMDITLDGPRTVVYLNAVKVTDFTEGQPVPPKPPGSIDPDRGPRQDDGYIGLQNHPGSEVYFKEVSVTPLPK